MAGTSVVQRVGERRDLVAEVAYDVVGRAFVGIFKPSDEGAADDDAVGRVAQGADVFGLADAEADAQWKVGLRAEPAELVEQLGRELRPLAGDADDADAV